MNEGKRVLKYIDANGQQVELHGREPTSDLERACEGEAARVFADTVTLPPLGPTVAYWCYPYERAIASHASTSLKHDPDATTTDPPSNSVGSDHGAGRRICTPEHAKNVNVTRGGGR